MLDAVMSKAMRTRLATGALVLAGAIANGPSGAFEVFPFDDGGQTGYLKWGASEAGTPGGEVTWSLVPVGTTGDAAYCGDACPGVSVATIPVEIAPGGGFADRSLDDLRSLLEAAFARWEAATGIRFRFVGADAGLPINAPEAGPPGTGHIRVGIFAFASGGAAVGYAPPPNGGTGAGDVLLNANAFFQLAPIDEGEAFDPTFAPNDLPSLLLHEIGHAIGLAHPPPDGSCPVMDVDSACLFRVNRELDPDDLTGARFLYGHLFGDGFENRAGPASMLP